MQCFIAYSFHQHNTISVCINDDAEIYDYNMQK